MNLKRRRKILWEQDPRCRNCGVETELPPPEGRDDGSKPPEYEATIQHIHSRLSLERGKARAGEEVTTLFCWKCNNDDNKVVQAGHPVSDLRRRSGHETGSRP